MKVSDLGGARTSAQAPPFENALPLLEEPLSIPPPSSFPIGRASPFCCYRSASEMEVDVQDAMARSWIAASTKPQ